MSGLTPQDVMNWRRHAAGSPLYSQLMTVIAGDVDLMRVLNEIENEPPPNVLLAGVQYLLMTGSESPLAGFYPNLATTPTLGEVDDHFRRFVLDHESELVDIGRTRQVQTNEVRRCACLLPVIWDTGVTRFHLVDLGTSAGLNLLLDRFSYRWGALEWGPESPVLLECESRGRPPLPHEIDVISRTGLDLNPLDPADPEDRTWLEALIWPEQEERRRRLRDALDLSRSEQLDLVAGDAVETLGDTLRVLTGDPIVMMHSFALNQLGEGERSAIDDELARARAAGQVVWRVSMELLDWGDEAPTLMIDDGSGPLVVGQGHPHGEWVELYARP